MNWHATVHGEFEAENALVFGSALFSGDLHHYLHWLICNLHKHL